MAFNPPIAPEERTKEHVAVHFEMYKRTQDVIRIHNPTDEDFIVYNDRMVTNEQWVIPNKNQDLGKGKGNFDVPRYIALRYLDQMGKKLIGEKSRREWNKIKDQYRTDERGSIEERVAIKLTDATEWKKVTPKLWIGVVKRYQAGNMAPIKEKEEKKITFSKGEEALADLDLIDAEIGAIDSNQEEAKESFIEQIS